MQPYVADSDFVLYVGDARHVLAGLPAESVDCCVTSSPYWGLRDYGTDGQIGLEQTPEEFVAEMVAVFRQVRRVLAPHGTLWLNLGDSYAGQAGGAQGATGSNATRTAGKLNIRQGLGGCVPNGLKPKDLVGIPWRVAFALQADGWYLRADIIWAKPNPMPESVTDRPTKAHEYVFLLSKQPRYFFDQEAVRERAVEGGDLGILRSKKAADGQGPTDRASIDKRLARGIDSRDGNPSHSRNVRSVWDIATQPYPDAHFATFPEALPERCIKAGCPERVCRTCGEPSERVVKRTKTFESGSGRSGNGIVGKQDLSASDTNSTPDIRLGPVISTETLGWSDCGHGNYRTGVVLDPFIGSGTTALVARRLGRKCVGVELNPEYADLAARRLSQLSLLAEEQAG